MDPLSGLQWFCTLDLASGYRQVEMAEKDKEKREFSMPLSVQYDALWSLQCSGHFREVDGESSCGLTLQMLLIFADDVIVHAKSFKEVMRHL